MLLTAKGHCDCSSQRAALFRFALRNGIGMNNFIAGAIALLLPACLLAQTLPPGWVGKPAGSAAGNTAVGGGAQIFIPADLQPGEAVAVVYYPAANLAAQTIDAWVEDALVRDAPMPGGTWQGAPDINREAQAVVSATRAYRDATGNQGFAVYMAVSKDQRTVRLARWTASSEPVGKRYKDAAKFLLQQLATADKTSARTDSAARRPAAQKPVQSYQWVSAPGKGLQAAQIETVVYGWRQVFEIGGLQMRENAYLLLKDGTVHDGLPVPPQDMDIAASRQQEPAKWGRWQRSGKGYAFAWPDKPGEFKAVQGGPMQAVRAGVLLEGEWTASSSYAIPGGGGAWSKWGLRLTRDGRFEKFRYGGAGAGGAGSGMDVVTASVWDDKGAVTAANAPNVTVRSSKQNGPRGDLTGRYEIDGYAITLRQDDGLVVRLPFFTEGEQHKKIWFEGALLVRK